MWNRIFFRCIVFLLLASCLALGQEESSVVHPNQEVRVSDLPMHTAQSADATAVLAASLETIFHDPDVCCGKNSALEDADLSADSLKELGGKLAGKHRLSDGRTLTVTAEYSSPDSINPNQIIGPLLRKQALLMQWDSHFYVLYGAVYDEIVFSGGHREYVIHKLLLLDTRFSDARRETAFNRETDDWTKVQGLLRLAAEAQ